MVDKSCIGCALQASIYSLARLLRRLGGTDCFLQSLIPTGPRSQSLTGSGMWRSWGSGACCCFCRHKLREAGTLMADSHQDRDAAVGTSVGVLPVQCPD